MGSSCADVANGFGCIFVLCFITFLFLIDLTKAGGRSGVEGVGWVGGWVGKGEVGWMVLMKIYEK